MEPTDLAAAAVGMLLTYLRAVGDRLTARAATATEQAVLDKVRWLASHDPHADHALAVLERDPDNAGAASDLRARIAATAAGDAGFRDALASDVPVTVHAVASSQSGPAVTVVQTGGGRAMAKVKIKLITMTRSSGGRWMLVGIALAALMFPVAICSAGVLLVRSTTTFFDTKTTIETARGWRYSVSEAHVKTSPQLRDRGPARPGYRYLYFDITVRNLLDDREAPGIDFHFARATGALGENCGSEGTYVPGIVAGWCLSDNDNFFTGGASCFETNDQVFHNVDNIPPGGRNQVRCVDSYYVPDDFDLDTVKVYYTGGSVVSAGTDYPSLTEIPTKT